MREGARCLSPTTVCVRPEEEWVGGWEEVEEKRDLNGGREGAPKVGLVLRWVMFSMRMRREITPTRTP